MLLGGWLFEMHGARFLFRVKAAAVLAVCMLFAGTVWLPKVCNRRGSSADGSTRGNSDGGGSGSISSDETAPLLQQQHAVSPTIQRDD